MRPVRFLKPDRSKVEFMKVKKVLKVQNLNLISSREDFAVLMQLFQ